jgi:nucleoside-diphosphate-sugar epimerase
MNWERKRVLIAGGAGMIGSHLAHRLVELGAEVTVVDNYSSGSVSNILDFGEGAWFYERDLRHKRETDKFTKGKDVVFQFAANMGGIGYITSVHADIVRDSALINIFMLESARKNEVPLYFYSSSACVYPEYRQTDEKVVPLKETDAYPAMPDQYYGWEKLFTEKVCEAYMEDYGMNIRIARFHNVYGSAYTAFDEAKAKVPCKMILRAIQYPEKKIEIWNDGNQTRSFCYISDCIDGVLRLMESDYKKPINIGSDYLISMNDLAELVREISGKDMDYVRYPEKAQGVRGRNSDNTLVKEVLNWSPKVSLRDGMTEVYQWAVKHYDELEGIK